jgi:UDP-glucose 4-epimerase
MAGAGSDLSPENARPVVVTGAGGFIGRALCAHWQATGRPFRAVVRRVPAGAPAPSHLRACADLAGATDAELDALVAGAAAIVHLAGRAHVMVEGAADPAAAYRGANVEATARLARAAVRAGVARFVFASSIKVNGEATAPGRPFGPADVPAPADEYARSKLAAEEGLAAVAAGTALAPIVLRLPLVYGPGVGANFLALVDAVARRRVLPLGAVRAKRSLLYVGNLAGAVDAVLDAPVAPLGVHCVADAPAVSVPDLVRAIAGALGVEARLPAVPVPLLSLAGRLAGRGDAIRRLVTALEVDAARFRAATGWTPAATLEQGLAETARWWRSRHVL